MGKCLKIIDGGYLPVIAKFILVDIEHSASLYMPYV